MAVSLWTCALAASLFAPGSLLAVEDDPLDAQRQAEGAPQLLLVPVTGSLTTELTDSLLAQIDKARSDYRQVQYVVFTLNSEGGDLAAARKISSYILEQLKGLTTIAFVPPGKAALAESLLVAFSSKELILGGDARLGANLSRDASPEKDRALRDALRAVASSRKLPSLVLDAMASAEHDEVYRRRVARGLNAEDFLFQTKGDLDAPLPGARNDEPVLVIPKGQRLLVSAQEAVEKFRLSRHGADNMAELQNVLRISIADENLIELGIGPRKLALSPSWQGLIEALNTPFARFLLILTACLAALIEVKTFGMSVAGTISVIAFGVFFLAASFPTQAQPVATCTLWEASLFAIGLGLFAVEFLFLPGMAIFAISGAALCAVSMVLAMLPADSSQLSGEQTMGDAVESAIGILAYGFAGGCVFFLLVVRLFSRKGKASGGLVTSATITGVPTADSAIAAQAIQAELIGKTGATATTLRPAGKVELDDGRVLDVVALGEYIEKGTRVRVTSIDGGIITVNREVAPPG